MKKNAMVNGVLTDSFNRNKTVPGFYVVKKEDMTIYVQNEIKLESPQLPEIIKGQISKNVARQQKSCLKLGYKIGLPKTNNENADKPRVSETKK